MKIELGSVLPTYMFILFAHRMVHWENSLSTAPELAGMAKPSRVNFSNSTGTFSVSQIHALIQLSCNFVYFSCIFQKIVYLKTKNRVSCRVSCTIHW